MSTVSKTKKSVSKSVVKEVEKESIPEERVDIENLVDKSLDLELDEELERTNRGTFEQIVTDDALRITAGFIKGKDAVNDNWLVRVIINNESCYIMSTTAYDRYL